MRLPWQKRVPPGDMIRIDSNRPHEFRSRSDGGIAALTPIGGGLGRQVADIASVNAYTRTIGCAVPGCGKAPDALIHAPEA